jgi:hypothetical protein
MTNKEKFEAGLPFTHPFLGRYAGYADKTTGLNTPDSIHQCGGLGSYLASISKITPSHVFVYSFWLTRKLKDKLLFVDMTFYTHEDVDKVGKIIEKNKS